MSLEAKTTRKRFAINEKGKVVERRQPRAAAGEPVTRKSLMISLAAHQHLMDMAGKFGVSQPELVEALIKSADKARLTAALAEIAAARERAVREAEAKKSLLEKAFDNLSLAEIEELLGRKLS